jgi:hypothetical protein
MSSFLQHNMSMIKMEPDLCGEICEDNVERESDIMEGYSTVQCEGGNGH